MKACLPSAVMAACVFYNNHREKNSVSIPRNGSQFSDGITVLSITINSTGPLIGSSFNPSC